MKPFIYETTVRFSDTDLYGVVHHSNYFKWLEEARIQAMEELVGLSIDWLEKSELRFPVISIQGKYKKSIFARQKIQIQTYLYCNSSAKMVFEYKIIDENNRVCFIGETQHAIMSGNRMCLKMPQELEDRIKEKMSESKEEYFISWKIEKK